MATAREYGLLDEGFALVVGAHLSANDALETEANNLSQDILNQVSPPYSADGLQSRIEDLASRISAITNRNPLDEDYDGPKFDQAQNDYFSGKVLQTASDESVNLSVAAKQAVGDAIDKATSFTSTLIEIAVIVGVIVLVISFLPEIKKLVKL